MNVVLKPVSNPRLGPIVLSGHQLSVGRTEPPFADYEKALTALLSRRHARVYKQGAAVYVADLGSLNGTSVNGVPLGNDAVELHAGDELCFGGELTFSVEMPKDEDETVMFVAPSGARPEVSAESAAASVPLEAAKPESSMAATAPMPEEEPESVLPAGEITSDTGAKTTFVSAADSFLNIFCEEDAKAKQGGRPEDQPGAAQLGKAAKQAVAGGRRAKGPLSRAGVFMGELKGALGDGEPRKGGRRRWWVLAVLTILALGSGWWYWQGMPEREVKGLLAQQEYSRALELARGFLQRRPGDEAMEALAEQALIKGLVPRWIALIKQGNFTEAEGLLDHIGGADQDGGRSGKSGSKPSAGLSGNVALLRWVGDLEAFIAERGGGDAPIVLFEQESRIRSLLAWWDRDIVKHRQGLMSIASMVPAFQPIQQQAVSHLRTLRNDESVYLRSIDKLLADVRSALQQGRTEAIGAKLDAFEAKYPRVQGIALLRADLGGFISLQQAAQTQDVTELARLRASLEFRTPLFREVGQQVLARALPPPDVVDLLGQASRAWQSGQVDQAVAILGTLVQSEWATLAEHRLARYQRVIDGYQALQSGLDQPDYGERVLAFYASLEPDEDRFFVARIEALADQHKGEAQNKAQAAIDKATKQWKAYRGKGGIGGLLRVEGKVSDRYKQQAGRLSEAYEQLQHGLTIYELLRSKVPPAAKALLGQVRSEVQRQRDWLDDMRLVLEPALLEKKLALLPDLEPQEKKNRQNRQD